MKRRDLLKKIAKAAKASGGEFGLVREGAEHTLYQLNGQRVVVPRHGEINEITVVEIMKDLEGQLGREWWK